MWLNRILMARHAMWSLAFAATICLQACSRTDREATAGNGRDSTRVSESGSKKSTGLRYARGFALQTRHGLTLIQVKEPWKTSVDEFSYLLVSKADSVPPHSPGEKVIRVPAGRAVTLSTTNISHLERLGVLDALAGMGGGGYVCNPALRSRLRAGSVREVGGDLRVNIEALLQVKPDVVFSYYAADASGDVNRKLETLHLPVVMDGSYMEETPLARAEWIKFTAAFFGREAAADSLFSVIDSAYQALAALAAKALKRPTVFVNDPIGGIWWMPGGKSYMAKLLADAGAEYLWASDSGRGSLSLDLEGVMARAAMAEFWLNPGDWRSLADGRDRDRRFSNFRAYREGGVYNNNAILCGEGGNDFYETGAARPDWILADLIAVFHPELLPGHKFRWYRKLEKDS